MSKKKIHEKIEHINDLSFLNIHFGFGQKNRNQKLIISITTNEIDRTTKLINRQCSRFEFGILNNKKSFIQKHMVIRIKRK
jgi:hypothetical protein